MCFRNHLSTFEGVRSPRLGIVKDTVQCRDRFAEFDYQRLIGRVHRLPPFPALRSALVPCGSALVQCGFDTSEQFSVRMAVVVLHKCPLASADTRLETLIFLRPCFRTGAYSVDGHSC